MQVTTQEIATDRISNKLIYFVKGDDEGGDGFALHGDRGPTGMRGAAGPVCLPGKIGKVGPVGARGGAGARGEQSDKGGTVGVGQQGTIGPQEGTDPQGSQGSTGAVEPKGIKVIRQ